MHLEAFLKRLAQKYRIGIVGTIVHGTLPAPTDDPFPTVDPFTHLTPETALAERTAPTPEQRAWVEWLGRNMTDRVENAGHPQAPVLHNTAFFIDDHGEVIGEYIKRNLWIPERWVFVLVERLLLTTRKPVSDPGRDGQQGVRHKVGQGRLPHL